MDDPWAAPTTTATPAMTMRMPSSPRLSPTGDVADPWAPAPPKVSPKLPKWEAPKSLDRPSWEEGREGTASPVIDEGWGASGVEVEAGDNVSSPRPSAERVSYEQASSVAAEDVDARHSSDDVKSSLDAGERISSEQEAFGAPEAATVEDVIEPATLDTSIGRLSLDQPDTSFASVSLAAPEPNSALRRSPSFGSDFGDFGTGSDPWGAGNTSWTEATLGGWGAEPEAEAGAEDQDETPVAEGKGWGDSAEVPTSRSWGQDESWGGARAASPPPQRNKQEEDWEAAQRRIALSEARAPFELITRLKKDWEGVAADVAGENIFETSEETEDKLVAGAAMLEENVRETIRSLTDPPDTTFSYASSATREKYTSALARASPNATSLLRVPVRQTRYEGLEFGPGLSGWSARSHLGEPEAPPAVVAAEEGEQKSGWSFWRRGNAQKPLVTSGGAILEVKSETSSPRSGTPVTAEPVATVAESPSRPASIAPSINASSVIAPSVIRASSTLSRSATPEVRPASPASVAEEKQKATAPSGFWGRFRRRPTSSDEQQQDQAGDNDRELELGDDDFAFLSEVPSMPQQGTDDLLGMGGSMASLDTVLGLKAVPLPAPLAPPPKSNVPRPPQGGFQARMAAPARQASDFDLLSGLDFDSPADMSSGPAQTTSSSTSTFNWDDLLAPSSSSKAPASGPVPQVPPPKASSPVPRLATPPGRSSPVPRTSSPLAGAAIMPSLQPPKPSTPSPLSPTQSTGMSSMFGLQQPMAATQSRPSSMFDDLSSLSSNSPSLNPVAANSQPRTSTDGPPSRNSSVALDFGFAGGSKVESTSTPSKSSPSPTPTPFGNLSSFAALAPSPPTSRPSSAFAPPPTSTFTPPMAPTQSTPQYSKPTAQASDDFGDFGDFGSFDQGATSLDDDFGDFSSTLTPAPPTPIAKSAAPTPIAKSPAYAASMLPSTTMSTPSPARGATQTTPVFTRPSNLPTGLRTSPRLPSDHSATLELLTAAATQIPPEREAPSPIAPAIAPPPSKSSFNFPPPPPSGASRRTNVDLLGDL